MPDMSNQQRVILGIVFAIAAVLSGALIAALTAGGPASPTASPIANVSPSTGAAVSPSAEPGSASPSSAPASETPGVSPSTTPSRSPSASPSASPTTAPLRPATITFTQLKLDAKNDPAGLDRIITFQSQGPGTITAKLTSLSPQGTTRMCLSAGTTLLGCRSAASGTLTAKTTSPKVNFTLTMRGVAIDTPTVQMVLTFPATTPSAKIANARFDGTAFPDYNGLQALVTPRTDGNVRLVADWGGHPFLYEIDLREQGGTGSQTLANQGPAPRVDVPLPVSGTNKWKLVLQNSETGFGVTNLTATVSWP